MSNNPHPQHNKHVPDRVCVQHHLNVAVACEMQVRMVALGLRHCPHGIQKGQGTGKVFRYKGTGEACRLVFLLLQGPEGQGWEGGFDLCSGQGG